MKKILVISPYSAEGKYSHKESALSSFNLNLMSHLKGFQPFVLADNEDHENNVYKIWRKNDPRTYYDILKAVAKYPLIKKVLVQFEWGVFGKSMAYMIGFPVFLLGLRLLGKEPVVVLHGVNFQFEDIYGKGLKSTILNLGSVIFYTLTCIFSKKVVVTEAYFRNELSRLLFCKYKVEFIPHGVDNGLAGSPMKKEKSKCELAYFGFINPYKGPNELLKLYGKIDRSMYGLSLYGGFSPNLRSDRNYQEYESQIRKTSRQLKVKISGFLNESELNKAFSKTDLIILPYKSFLSSSGMLAMAFAHEKPFLISRPLARYLESPDFRQAVKDSGLNQEDLIFDFDEVSFAKKIDKSKSNMKKLTNLSRIMRKERDWKNIAKQYEKILK